MALFGSTKTQPPPKQKPLGIDESRIATNEAARPVPMLYGRARVGLTFITGFYNMKANQITQEVSKGNRIVTGYNYYAGIAALLCAGPVDELIGMFVNGEHVWGRDRLDGAAIWTRSAKPHGVNVTDLGDLSGGFFLYWGTETQGKYALLDQYTGVTHPAYRGWCYVVFPYLYLGANQTNFPQVEFLLGRYPGTDDNKIVDDANAAHVVRDVLQHPRCGVGVPDSVIDLDMMAAASDGVVEEKFGISDLITEPRDARQTLLRIAETVDGFYTASNGKIGFRLARFPKMPVDMAVLTETDFVSRPKFEPGSWLEIPNEVRVKFTNRARNGKEDVRIWRDQSSLNISGGEPKALNLDRTMITRATAAETAAKIAGQKLSLPTLQGSVTLRRHGFLFGLLKPGNWFKFDCKDRELSWPIFRVTQRVLPGPDKMEFSIQFEAMWDHISKLNGASLDISLSGSGGEAADGVPDDADDGGFGGPIEVTPLLAARVVELPLALCPEGRLHLALIAARGAENTSAVDVHLDNVVNGEFAASYDLVKRISSFALHGHLQSDIPRGGSTIDLETGAVIQLDGIDQSLSDFTTPDVTLHDALVDHYLIFIGGEILSLAGFSSDGFPQGSTGLYRIYFTRERFATRRSAHMTGAEIFIIRKSDLLALDHPHFQVGNTSRLKLCPVQMDAIMELGNVEPIDVPIEGFIFKQTPPINLRCNEALADVTYTDGEAVTFKWELTNAGRDLHQDQFVRRTVVLELCNTAEEVLHRREINGTSLALTHAQLTALLGGAIDFIVRVKMQTDTGLYTLDSAASQLTVTKV